MAVQPPTSLPRARWWRYVGPVPIALLAFLYAGAHLVWYRATPLGQFPVLDEQENLLLAEQIVRGELPKEPFYRAMGYPLLLAGLRHAGIETVDLFSAALGLGVLLHALNTLLVTVIARTWFDPRASIGSGLLYALNPALVHYATQALDATPALTLFLLGFVILAPELGRGRDGDGTRSRWAPASLLWAAAVACRPNYLVVWAALPVMAMWILGRGRRAEAAFAALSGLIVFGNLAVWQWRVSDVVGFLPWQGTYNLWAANQPGTHGRYFVQRVDIPSTVAAVNTARAESIFLFRQEKGVAPADPRELNAHWRRRFVDHVRQNPTAWLATLGGKLHALLNNWEQYNNKTFAFHRERSPWLRWNPLGWGVVFILGVAAAIRIWRTNRQLMRSLGLIAGCLCIGVLLFYASGRFRLPLVALATVLSGAGFALLPMWPSLPRREHWAAALLIPGAALLAYSNFGGVRDRGTFVEDHALLARAAERVGDITVAWDHALAALAYNPKHRDATRVAVTVFFNALARGGKMPGPESTWLEISRRFLAANESDARELQAIAGLALWRANQRVDAVEAWRRLGRSPSAIAARLLVNDRTVSRVDLTSAPRSAWTEPLVRLAAARLDIPPPPGVPPADPSRAAEVLDRLLGTSGSRH